MQRSILKIIIPILLFISFIVSIMVKYHSNEPIEIDINKLIAPLILLTIEGVIFGARKIYRDKIYKKCNYNREVDNIVEPAIAEYIINSKIDNKNMIMTLLLDLNTRGNVQFESDNRIRLLNYNDVKDYEKRILNSVFRESKVITFKELNNMFIVSNKKTSQFFKDMKDIKYLIKDKTYMLKIYDIKKRLILDFIQLILVMIAAYLCATVLSIEEPTYVTFIIIVASILFLSIKYSNDIVVDISNARVSTNKSNLLKDALTLLMVMPFVYFIFDFFGTLDTIIYLVDLLLVGILLQPNILTKKGKEEYLKLLGLKKYIEDYSLMEERSNMSVELWEKYLVYATAFGIPNKVISTFKNSYLNANITLQVLSNLISTNDE